GITDAENLARVQPRACSRHQSPRRRPPVPAVLRLGPRVQLTDQSRVVGDRCAQERDREAVRVAPVVHVTIGPASEQKELALAALLRETPVEIADQAAFLVLAALPERRAETIAL